MRKLLVFLLPVLSWAAVEGVVTNQTSGKPQSGVTVTLVRLGNAMDTVGSSQTDAQGRFRFEQDLQSGSPHLLQAAHQGVTYNKMLPPGSASTGVQLEVFDAAAQPGEAKVTQHMLLLEPSGTELVINETIIYANTGKVTFNSPEGTLRFYVPPEVKAPVRVSVQGPSGMPVQRPAEKGKDPNTFFVNYPIRPGETRIDLSYSVPAGSPTKFASKILHGGGPVRIVAPQGVTLDSPALVTLGTHPSTQATIYELKGHEYAVDIKGTGSLRAAMGAQEGQGEEDATPSIEQAKPRIYRRLYAVLGLAFTMLLLGFILLYRTDRARA